MMTALMTVSYRSVSRLSDTRSCLQDLLAASTALNSQRKITSLLLFDGTHFMQTLEGPGEAIGDLILTIAKDPRHSDVALFAVKTIDIRGFPNWPLKLIGRDDTQRIVPDMEEFDFSDRRLAEVHKIAKATSAGR